MAIEIVDISNRFSDDDRFLSDGVSAMLRDLLVMAERGELVSIALAGEKPDGDMLSARTVAAPRYQTIGALVALQHELLEILNERAE